MTGTPTTISEQPRTSVNVKPLEKPQEGYPGTPANIVLRIPPLRHCVPLNNTLVPVENEREYSSWGCCLKREKVVMASARCSYVAYE